MMWPWDTKKWMERGRKTRDKPNRGRHPVGKYRMLHPLQAGEQIQVELTVRRERGTDETTGFMFTAPANGHYVLMLDETYVGLVRLQGEDTSDV